MNQRYLNFYNPPVVSRLTRLLKIELYNNTYLPLNFKYMSKPSMNMSSYQIDTSAFSEHKWNPNLSLAATLVDASSNAILLIKIAIPCNPKTPIHRSADLSDKLFFIQHTPDGTLRCICYIIQIDKESTIHANAYYASNHLCWCVFLARYPDDHKKSN